MIHLALLLLAAWLLLCLACALVVPLLQLIITPFIWLGGLCFWAHEQLVYLRSRIASLLRR